MINDNVKKIEKIISFGILIFKVKKSSFSNYVISHLLESVITVALITSRRDNGRSSGNSLDSSIIDSSWGNSS